MEVFLLICYAIPLVFIFSFSLVQLSLIINYLAYKKDIKKLEKIDEKNAPFVTIQLPIYNELYVVERIIEAVSNFDYPKSRFEIQVLDDSTDETSEIIAKKIANTENINIQHIRRPNRLGYKAGALAYGLSICKGEFIAIFDADFEPPRNFLQQTIPYFNDNKIGVVQTRWQHLNENYSILTKLQAFGLDAHFTIEQVGRNLKQHFINFNGTAGVWRKKTIENAGGWSADTLTEDLDLSYRAQLLDWQFLYLPEVSCPAELPVAMSAIKSQQYRWTKGAAECAIKNLSKLLNSSNLSFSTKLQGFYHLMNSSVFVAILLLGTLSLPIAILTPKTQFFQQFFYFSSFFQLSWLILGCFYWISFQKTGLGFITFLKRFFLFLIFMMGLSFHNAIAVIEGWLGIKTPFIRTPKFNLKNNQTKWQKNKYITKKLPKSIWFEIALFLFFLTAICYEIFSKNYNLLPFHTMLLIGYGCIIFYTFREKIV